MKSRRVVAILEPRCSHVRGGQMLPCYPRFGWYGSFPPVPTQGVWAINSSYSGGLGSVACPIASACYAVGPPVLTSKNGASTWHTRNVPTNWSLRGLSCPAVSTCFSVGEDMSAVVGLILETTDSGRTWTPPKATHGRVGLQRGVVCNQPRLRRRWGNWYWRGCHHDDNLGWIHVDSCGACPELSRLGLCLVRQARSALLWAPLAVPV